MKPLSENSVTSVTSSSPGPADEKSWEPSSRSGRFPGLADGSLGFVTDGASIEVPQAILDKAEEAKAWVVSGGIELPTKVDGIEEWAAQNGLK